MSLTPEEETTLKTYNAKAQHWAALHSSPGAWKEEMEILRKFLPGGKILEIGSGGGRDAKELIAMGYDYVGTDISEGLLETAKKVNPGVSFLNQSVYDLSFPNGTRFDGFWACAVLLYIPKAKIDQALQNIRKYIRNQGIGFIAVKEGKGEELLEDTENGQVYERFFSFYSEQEFREVLLRNHFEILEFKKRQRPQTSWLCFFVRVK